MLEMYESCYVFSERCVNTSLNIFVYSVELPVVFAVQLSVVIVIHVVTIQLPKVCTLSHPCLICVNRGHRCSETIEQSFRVFAT